MNLILELLYTISAFIFAPKPNPAVVLHILHNLSQFNIHNKMFVRIQKRKVKTAIQQEFFFLWRILYDSAICLDPQPAPHQGLE